MHTSLIIGLIVLAVVSVFGIRHAAGGHPAAPVYQKITAKEAHERLAKDPTIVLVDVRTPAEYAEKRISNSLLIPVDDIEKLAPGKLPKKDAAIFVYCRSGRRSQAAAQKLLQMGYTNVVDFGGINDWPYATVSGAAVGSQ